MSNPHPERIVNGSIAASWIGRSRDLSRMLGNGHVRFLRGRDGGNAVLLPDRALRCAVWWRKGSFGHKSDGGGAFVETMLTVCGSLRLQGRGVMEFVQAACRAALAGEDGPKLVPETAC